MYTAGTASPKPGAWNFTQVSQAGGRDLKPWTILHCLSRHIGRKLDQKWWSRNLSLVFWYGHWCCEWRFNSLCHSAGSRSWSLVEVWLYNFHWDLLLHHLFITLVLSAEAFLSGVVCFHFEMSIVIFCWARTTLCFHNADPSSLEHFLYYLHGGLCPWIATSVTSYSLRFPWFLRCWLVVDCVVEWTLCIWVVSLSLLFHPVEKRCCFQQAGLVFPWSRKFEAGPAWSFQVRSVLLAKPLCCDWDRPHTCAALWPAWDLAGILFCCLILYICFEEHPHLVLFMGGLRRWETTWRGHFSEFFPPHYLCSTFVFTGPFVSVL